MTCPVKLIQAISLICYPISQLAQAIGMKTMAENHRRWQNRIDSDGQGNTMGSMYWMLADIWQAPTWASIGKLLTTLFTESLDVFFVITVNI